MKTKKNIAVILLCMCSGFVLIAQNQYNMKGNYPSGESILDHDVFLFHDSGRFCIVNDENVKVDLKTCKWTVEGMNEQTENLVLIENNSTDYFEFNLDTLYIDKTLLSSLQRDIIENNNNVYHNIKIVAEGMTMNDEIIKCEKPIRFNILPAIPQIKFIAFQKGEIDSGYGDYWSYADFQIIQERQDYGRVIAKDYDFYGLTSSVSYPAPENEYFRYEFYYPFTEEHIIYATLIASSRNAFGSVGSDIFRVDNTIADYKTGLIKSEKENIILFPNPVKDSFTLNGIDDKAYKVSIVDLTGKIQKEFDYTKEKSYNISTLNQGIYTVIIHYTDISTRSLIKIIKY